MGTTRSQVVRARADGLENAGVILIGVVVDAGDQDAIGDGDDETVCQLDRGAREGALVESAVLAGEISRDGANLSIHEHVAKVQVISKVANAAIPIGDDAI